MLDVCAARPLLGAPLLMVVTEGASGSSTESSSNPRRCLLASIMVWTVVARVSARVVRWSREMCEMLSQHGPMSPSREAATLANRAVLDAFFCEVLVDLRLHRKHKVDLDRIAEIRDL